MTTEPGIASRQKALLLMSVCVGLLGVTILIVTIQYLQSPRRKTQATLETLVEQGALDSPEDLVLLEHVWVGDHSLSSEQCRAIQKIPNLEVFDATATNLTDEGVCELSKSKAIRSLIFRSSRVSDKTADCLQSMSKLEVLDISSTDITHEGVIRIAKSSSLKKLVLYEIQMTDNAICAISKVNRLRELSIDVHNISPAGISCLSQMNSLVALTLVGRPLTIEELQHLSRMKIITDFACQTSVDEQQMEALATMRSLQYLHIWCDPFKIELQALLKLRALPALKQLTIVPYLFSEEERKAVQEAMPNVRLSGGT